MKKANLKKILSIAVVGAMALTLAACGNGEAVETEIEIEEETGESVEAIDEEIAEETTVSEMDTEETGVLVLYASTPEEFLDVILNDFTEETGIEVEVVTGGTGELYNRVEAEKDNPQGDVVLGGMVYSGFLAYPDLWEDYVSVYDSELPEEYRNTNGKVTGFSLVPSALMINDDLVEGIEINGYEDLLNPELKGQIVMPDPSETSSGWEQLVNILYAMGGPESDEAWDYVDQLLANIDGAVLTSSGSVHKGVADGEYAVGLVAESMIDTYILEGMDNISKVFMEEGVVIQVDGVAIIKGCENLNSAQQFIDFLVSKDFQQTMTTCNPPRRPVRDDVTIPDDSALTPTDEIPSIEIDQEYVSNHRDEIQEKFQDISMNYMK